MERSQPTAGQIGKWRLREGSTPNRSQLSQLYHLIVPISLLIIGIILIVQPIWQAGFPWGSDSWGHLHRASYMGSMIREHGILEGFARSAWMPEWYLGDPSRVYYPPLALWILGPLTALTEDVFLAYRIFVTAILLVLGVSVYWIGNRWGHNRWLALGGALLAVMSPYTLRTIFAEGNFSRGVALLCLPWMIWFTEKLLAEKRTHVWFALLSGLWAIALIAHVMQAAIFVVVVALYIVVRLLGDIYMPLRRGVLALLTIAVGGLLACFYLIPAYGHLELANVPSLPADKIELFSITPAAILPYHVSIEAISVGVVSAVLAFVITFRGKTSHHKAFIFTSLICLLLAFGPAGVLFEFVPLKQSLLPERFINAIAVLIPLIVATTSRIRLKPVWLIAGFALVLLVEFVPAWRVVHMRDAPPDETAIAVALAEGELTGRVVPLTFPNPTASQIFLQSVVGEHENVSGWALENTPHQDAIRRLLYAAGHSPEYLRRIFSLWNVDYLVTRFGNAYSSLESTLPYREIGVFDTLELWERAQSSAFTQVIPDNRMLMIGDNATSWLFAFPFASEGEFADPAAYSPDYLARYSVIGINRIAQNSDVEASLGEWLREGNTLIADLSGLGSIYTEGYTLFGVHAFPLSIQETPQVHLPSELASISGAIEFPLTDGAWVGATYYGLDEVVASLTYQGEEYPLLGYRNVEAGRIWFVGFNLFYALDIAEAFEARGILADYLLAGSEVNRDLELPPFHVEALERAPDRIQFRYQNDEAADIILSMTYFPRWQATVDGAPIELQSQEHLIRLHLPPGAHTVTLTYQPYSQVLMLGFAVSACAFLALGCAVYVMWRQPILARADREDNFEDRLPQPPPTPEPDFRHEICPSCGYPQAIAGPPTAETYPFISIECPECGYKLGDVVS